jgi:hypothetical protein
MSEEGWWCMLKRVSWNQVLPLAHSDRSFIVNLTHRYIHDERCHQVERSRSTMTQVLSMPWPTMPSSTLGIQGVRTCTRGDPNFNTLQKAQRVIDTDSKTQRLYCNIWRVLTAIQAFVRSFETLFTILSCSNIIASLLSYEIIQQLQQEHQKPNNYISILSGLSGHLVCCFMEVLMFFLFLKQSCKSAKQSAELFKLYLRHSYSSWLQYFGYCTVITTISPSLVNTCLCNHCFLLESVRNGVHGRTRFIHLLQMMQQSSNSILLAAMFPDALSCSILWLSNSFSCKKVSGKLACQ